jgi:subfamily B ATP-binding cassette protein MsbA
MVPGVAWIMKTLSRACTASPSPARGHRRAGLCGGGERAGPPHGAPAWRPGRAVKRFGDLSRQLRGLAIKATIASAAMTPLTQLLAAFALSAVICIALWQSRTGGAGSQDVTVGGFVAFIRPC